MKKLILLLFVTIMNCNLPDIQCPPNLPCRENDLQYLKYEPPVSNPILPDQPVISMTTGNASLDVSWSSCANANNYNLYISTDGINYNMVSKVTSPYTIAGLTNDVNYHIIVSAQNADGETMSLDKIAKPGIIDNMDGTISVVSTGLTWSKCSQSDAIGNDTYNALNNDCSNGVPAKLIYCDTRFGCTDPSGLVLNGTGVSEVYNTCALKGIGWRVASRDELLAMPNYYSSVYWSDMVNDWYYPIEGWSQPQPYGGHVWVNPIAGYFGSANFADYTNPVTKAYVICVK